MDDWMQLRLDDDSHVDQLSSIDRVNRSDRRAEQQMWSQDAAAEQISQHKHHTQMKIIRKMQ